MTGRVAVYCHVCGRRIRDLERIDEHARVVGPVEAENGDPAGTLTTGPGKWPARPSAGVSYVDPAHAPDTVSGIGRRRFWCVGRRHDIERVVTQERLDATWERLVVGAGRRRIALSEL